MPAERIVVDRGEDPHGTVASAHAPDAVNAIVAQRGVEVAHPLLVGAGEVAVTREGVWRREWLPSERRGVVDGGLQFLRAA